MREDNESTAAGSNHDGSGDASRPSLPPPAFPPGMRRRQVRQPAHAPAKKESAFISPDDPLPSRDDTLAGAIISPDEPLVREDRGAFISPDDPFPDRGIPTAPDGDDDAEGVVTGMGDDAHLDPEELAAGGDPYVLDLMNKVSTLAEALKRRGEAGLRSTPNMDRFEATLRAYCVGYLAGRRAEEDDAPDF